MPFSGSRGFAVSSSGNYVSPIVGHNRATRLEFASVEHGPRMIGKLELRAVMG